MFPAALALTAGVVLDRTFHVPILFGFTAGLACLAAWRLAGISGKHGLALWYLMGSMAALGSVYHNWSRETVAEDDISHFASQESRLVRLRGVVHSEPAWPQRKKGDPLRNFDPPESTRFVLRVRQLEHKETWILVSGKAQVTIVGPPPLLHVGDEVELFGKLLEPRGPANPGEFDYAGFLRDQGIRALVSVEKSSEGVHRTMENWPWTLEGWLAHIRGWGVRVLHQTLPTRISGLASALLLGESSAMAGEDWEKYLRSGVIHVLAISGQHLVVLAGFLWLILRLFQVSRRRGMVAVALFLFAYALLTGGRPPVMRAAWMVLVHGLGVWLCRPLQPANTFALAWILVAVQNPTDLAGAGCQLSFLAVAVLYWGTRGWNESPQDPLDQLILESRPLWLRGMIALGKMILWIYLVNSLIGLAVAPLVAARYHLVSPIALLIGPPMVLLTSIALVAGFVLLFLAPLFGPLALVSAGVVSWSLGLCEHLVDWGVGLPGAFWYVPDLPEWWLWIFYLGFLAVLTMQSLHCHWLASLSGMLLWLAILVMYFLWPGPRDFRCTFLAVGHGGCTVLETGDGRILLYDAGAIAGPEVTRRHIAPFLWNRGVRRIDEVILSHGDLDHFNGLPALAERFSIGQVTCTPTFADRTTKGVALTLEVLERKKIPIRIVKAGDKLDYADLNVEVLHPPASGPPGNENARSMVLLLTLPPSPEPEGKRLKILLTGDLEGPGLTRVLNLPPPQVEILMAPHHGGATANPPELADRTRPRFVISSKGRPKDLVIEKNYYEKKGAGYLPTWHHGAVTLHRNFWGWALETFSTKLQYR